MMCGQCSCTDERACFDEETGEVCGWSEDSPGLCTFCAEGREIESDAPGDWDQETPELGPCCVCGREGGFGNEVRNVMMLHKKAPVSGTGWGCFQCGLSMDGAVAVLCDKCMENEVEVTMVCHGYPACGMRTPVSELVGSHEHDMNRHPEEKAARRGGREGAEQA